VDFSNPISTFISSYQKSLKFLRTMGQRQEGVGDKPGLLLHFQDSRPDSFGRFSSFGTG
jgi:hypothetical protein